ncbi:hypothetical protein B0T11DRAFT_276024 [Plectosphaerella cucumerina]|uniref:Uncharacterized protein n=1 Tax=Plectosphaerella cucumerina TaxID=40658 RepID=A0A8K0X6Q3_9PEZI|nr:hypothetical protein B0T11DRAFT_276024 [Plectosphaerella cucumerina]
MLRTGGTLLLYAAPVLILSYLWNPKQPRIFWSLLMACFEIAEEVENATWPNFQDPAKHGSQRQSRTIDGVVLAKIHLRKPTTIRTSCTEAQSGYQGTSMKLWGGWTSWKSQTGRCAVCLLDNT